MLNYSLCFSITTFGGKGAAGPNHSRSADYVVLYNANVEPAAPDEGEGITKEPIPVIIEDEDQYIAPTARLDCGRIYTVEDNLRVAKIGRVHPDSLDKLEEYYQQSVL
ncbi:hypothetical protein C8A00DRAFT_18051 [Chaetomidium leptoderma]|uniref:DUF6590 domain-containing protein n=1 Tax=Chaetomidium leptoderma TaxID=669021 RepID=A0AAN6VH31_9PEZI|nr:hypothetical protein C8A00DRAFT_18051 [Chaetomidium leptoderma]